MWGADWRIMAAENIDGINSVIWKARDYYGGPDSFWLSLHDQNWEFYDSRDPGWPGDPRRGEAADDQFYITETDFNIDFNDDGSIGIPPNADPSASPAIAPPIAPIGPNIPMPIAPRTAPPI